MTAIIPCGVCGNPFLSGRNAKYCSGKCRTRAGVGTPTVRLTYRSRIRGFRIIEDVDPEVVFARDHGVCYLCDLPVDRTYRAPTAATMDHVIPLSGGGVHSYANVRLAHRRCNLLKADKILDETGTKR